MRILTIGCWWSGFRCPARHLERALREDADQSRMKYRTPVGRRRTGAARTIGLLEQPLAIPVATRDIAVYAALAGGVSHE